MIMAMLTSLPNTSYLSGPRPFSPTAFPSVYAGGPPSAEAAPDQWVSDPFAAQGVTGMQSETADEMTGGFGGFVDKGGTLAGVTGDGFSNLPRTVSGAARGGAHGASGAARGASGAAHGASGAAHGASGAARGASGAGHAVSGFAHGAGRVLGPAAVGLDLVGGGLSIHDALTDKTLTDDQRNEKVGEATVGTAGSIAGGAGGAWAGAAAGAALGSVVPVVGTVVGGIAGAVIGGFLGGSAGSKAGEAAGGTGAGKGVGGFVSRLFGK